MPVSSRHAAKFRLLRVMGARSLRVLSFPPPRARVCTRGMPLLPGHRAVPGTNGIGQVSPLWAQWWGSGLAWRLWLQET